jgi:hypothetical protein
VRTLEKASVQQDEASTCWPRANGEIHYGGQQFTYDGKEKAEFVEWTGKKIHDEIIVYLQKYLTSKSVMLADVVRVQVVVGGNHGDTAFQFSASVSVHLRDGAIIDFKSSVVVSRLVMYCTKVLMYRTMVLLAPLTKVRR